MERVAGSKDSDHAPVRTKLAYVRKYKPRPPTASRPSEKSRTDRTLLSKPEIAETFVEAVKKHCADNANMPPAHQRLTKSLQSGGRREKERGKVPRQDEEPPIPMLRTGKIIPECWAVGAGKVLPVADRFRWIVMVLSLS